LKNALATFSAECRVVGKNVPTDDIKQAEAEFPGITVEIKRILSAEPLVPSPGATSMTERLCARASERFGEPNYSQGEVRFSSVAGPRPDRPP
jgi:hypothetical protein